MDYLEEDFQVENITYSLWKSNKTEIIDVFKEIIQGPEDLFNWFESTIYF